MSYQPAVLTPRQANRSMGWTHAKLNAYWNARAQACKGFANEGSCLARVARHRPVTIAGLGATNMRAYWNARAQACRGYADEGSCLARVARHRPVTIGVAGLGVDAADVSEVTNVIAGLLRDPDGTLRVRGPALVAATDRYVIDPMVQRLAAASAPYLLKYILPPLAVLYVLSGIGAYYSYRTARKMQANPGRRSRRRRRTSR